MGPQRFVMSFFLLLTLNANVVFSNNSEDNKIPFLKNLNSEQDYKSLMATSNSVSYVKLFYDWNHPQEGVYFQNTLKYQFHIDFMRNNIERFTNLNFEDYENLILKEGTKHASAGAIYFGKDKKTEKKIVGFTLYYRNFSLEEVKMIYEQLKKSISFIEGENFVYIFETKRDYFRYSMKLRKAGVKSRRFEQFASIGETPITYHAAKSYGYLRAVTKEQLHDGDYNEKDILLLKETTLDVGPTSGIISTYPQMPNSHVILRTINQNIPNIYLPNALRNPAIERNIDKLIGLIVDVDGKMEIIDESNYNPEKLKEDAEKYFSSRVPLFERPRYNLDIDKLLKLREVDPLDREAMKQNMSTYGAKGTNFALMNRFLTDDIGEIVDRSIFSGSFLIPFAFYHQHVEGKLTENLCRKASKKCPKSFPVEICQSLENKCLRSVQSIPHVKISDFIRAKYIAVNLQDAPSNVVSARLSFIRDLIKKAELDPKFVEMVKDIILETYPVNRRIRFRSSTNAEDLPGLTGAGLYNSKAACLADELQTTADGMSACITEIEKARTLALIEKLRSQDQNNSELEALAKYLEKKMRKKRKLTKAIKGVFASLWSEKAFLSRNYYKLPHDAVFMGILVHPSFIDESANGVVVVSPKPNGISEFNIVVQKDDISVTNPELPGTTPEQIILKVSTLGRIISTEYVQASNIVENGSKILTKNQVNSLVTQILTTQRGMERVDPSNKGMVDIEFKVSSDGKVIMKQFRVLKSTQNVTPEDPTPPPAIKCNTGQFPGRRKMKFSTVEMVFDYCLGGFGTPGSFKGNLKRVTIVDTSELAQSAKGKYFYMNKNEYEYEPRHHNICETLQMKLPHATYKLTSGVAGVASDSEILDCPPEIQKNKSSTLYEIYYKDPNNPVKGLAPQVHWIKR